MDVTNEKELKPLVDLYHRTVAESERLRYANLREQERLEAQRRREAELASLALDIKDAIIDADKAITASRLTQGTIPWPYSTSSGTITMPPTYGFGSGNTTAEP